VVQSDTEVTIKYSQEALDYIPERNNDKKGIISVLLGLAQ
jgi:hypothetical protein